MKSDFINRLEDDRAEPEPVAFTPDELFDADPDKAANIVADACDGCWWEVWLALKAYRNGGRVASLRDQIVTNVQELPR